MKRREYIFLLLLFIAIFSLYFNGLKADFIMDDEIFIKNDVRIKQETNILNFFKTGYWTYPGEVRDYDYYRPLVLLSFYLDFKIYNGRREGFRITNILLLFLFSLFFFLFVKEILKFDFIASIVSTLLMAFHPLHSENIAWIVGRNETMYLMWGMAFLLYSSKYLRKKSFWLLALSYLFFVFGVFTKETFVLFWPILIILDILLIKSKKYLYLISFLIPLLFYYFIRSSVIRHTMFLYNIKPLGKSLFKVIASFGFYNKNLFFPFYFDKLMELFNFKVMLPYFFLGIIFFLILLYFTIKLLKNKDYLKAFGLLFSLTFTAFFSLMVLRYFLPAVSRYLSAAIPGIAIVEGLIYSKSKFKYKNIILGIILFAFSLQIIFNNSLFLSQERYFTYMVKRVPTSNYQRLALCRLKLEKGKYFLAIEMLKKIKYKRLRRLNRILYDFCLSKIYKRAAQYDRALFYLKDANKNIGNRVEKSWILIHLADILRRVGNYEKAEFLLKDYEKKFGRLYDLEAILWEIKISNLKWKEAKDIEIKIKNKFGYFSGEKTEVLAKRYKYFNDLQKIKFLERYLNFFSALNILKNLKDKIEPFEYNLKKAELCFKMGDERTGLEAVKTILNQEENPKKLLIASVLFKNKVLRPDLSVKFLKKLKTIIPDKKIKDRISRQIKTLLKYENFFNH